MALPFDILVLLAGLASLPTDPIEAAQVDGASPRQILVTIILPLLKPVIAVILVVRLADAFRIFDVVYVLTGGGPANATDVLSTYIYRQMFTVLRLPRRRRGGGAAGADHRGLLAACRAAPARPTRWRADGRADPAPQRLADIGTYVFLAVICVLVLVPIYWIVATSFKPTSEILVTPTSSSQRTRRSTTTASRSPATSGATSSTA